MASFLSSFSILNFAQNAIGYVLRNKVVALYSEGSEVLENSSIIKCNVMDKARLMEHPLEMGGKVVDHKVFEPVVAQVQIAMPLSYFETECEQLKQLYRQSAMLSLQTKAFVYDNLQIAGIPHEEAAENINRIIFHIELKEALLPQTIFVGNTKNVKSKADSNTKNVGQVQKGDSSILYKAFGGLFR